MASSTLLNTTLTLSRSSLTLLRLLPFLSTTASLTHAYMELITLSSFYRRASPDSLISRSMLSAPEKAGIHDPSKNVESDHIQTQTPEHELLKAQDIVIPTWFATWFNTAVWSVVALNSTTTLSAAANIFLFPDGLGASKRLYLCGLGAAVGHFVFVPGVAGSVGTLFRMWKSGTEGEERGRAARAAKEWIAVHRVRMATVDLAAWLCFGFGVVEVLSPGL